MNFTLNVLGTASALPTTERYPCAHVLNVRGRIFMIDCGEGTQIQLRKAGISFLRIEHICLSHIHGDHIFGIFGLLSTMGMYGRSAPLNIYAPKTFQPVLEFFLQTFGEGIQFEINHVALEMKEPEIVYSNRTLELLSFPLNHRVETYGFIIREKQPAHNVRKSAIEEFGLTLSEIGTLKRGEDVVRVSEETGEQYIIPNDVAAYIPYVQRSYAYCSDTAPFPELAEWVRGVTLLYHEATFPADMAEMAAKTYHSTTIQAAQTAHDAQVGKLLVGHYSARYPSVDFYRDELRSVFPDSELAHDGDKIELLLSSRT